MKTFLERHQVLAFGVVAATAVAALIAATALTLGLNSVEEELALARTDLERVQAGTAVFAAQITAFQEDLTALAPGIDEGLTQAIDGLDTFASSTITFDVDIHEDVAIDTELALDREIVVPIETSIPIRETIDTTITIAGPFGVDIPVDVEVPVNLDVPINLSVPIPVNETVPINTTIPVNVSVPISLDVADTELASLAESLRTGLISFRDVLLALG